MTIFLIGVLLVAAPQVASEPARALAMHLADGKTTYHSKVDFHHGVARFSWRMIEASGTTRMEGTDFVEIARDGRISRVVGFFGPLKQ